MAASEKFVPVLLSEVREMEKKFTVRGYPTVLFVDPETERPVAKLGPRDPASVVKQMEAAIAKALEED